MFYFLVLTGFSFTATANSNYQVILIEAEALTEKINRTGVLAFKRTLSLSFKSQGFLQKLKVDEGDLFLNNQLLAALDLTELKAEKNSAYAQLRQTKNDVQRITTLLSKNLSSEQELERMKTEVHTSRAAYKIAYYNLEKAEMRSPFTGVVLKRYAEIGGLQSPGRAVLLVAPLDKNIVVKVALTGKEVTQITLGQQVNVVLQRDDYISGIVSKISVVADPQNHLFTVEVLLPAIAFKNGAIAGQLAEVVFTMAKEELVYRIPIEALVAINLENEALLMVESSVSNTVHQQAFIIMKIDNKSLYVSADQNIPLNVVTRGWQQLTQVQRSTQ
ncbi:MAG: efflux RND transporter periplasmic adaptor subunit [Colwellia sp.]|nr:efflux RND transporter periplasmic adaptor subunit [Colwellia sp.]